jgi:hypothetical protein
MHASASQRYFDVKVPTPATLIALRRKLKYHHGLSLASSEATSKIASSRYFLTTFNGCRLDFIVALPLLAGHLGAIYGYRSHANPEFPAKNTYSSAKASRPDSRLEQDA